MKTTTMLSVLVAVVAMGTGCSATGPDAALDASNAVRSSRVVEFTAPAADSALLAGDYEVSFSGSVDEAAASEAPRAPTTGVSLRDSFASKGGHLSIVDAPVAPLSF